MKPDEPIDRSQLPPYAPPYTHPGVRLQRGWARGVRLMIVTSLERSAWKMLRRAHAMRHGSDDLHAGVHLVASMDAYTSVTGCVEQCELNALPDRIADRLTDILVPDTPPSD